MKTVIIFFLLTLSLTAQEIEYKKDTLIITSEKLIESVAFRVSTGTPRTENEPTNFYNVRNKKAVINLNKVDEEANEVVIYYINETVVLFF